MSKLKVNQITPLNTNELTIEGNLKLNSTMTVKGTIEPTIEWPTYLYNVISPLINSSGFINSGIDIPTSVLDYQTISYVSGIFILPSDNYQDLLVSAHDNNMEVVTDIFTDEGSNSSVQGKNKSPIQFTDGGIWWKPFIPWKQIKSIRVYTNIMEGYESPGNLPTFKIGFSSSHDYYSLTSTSVLPFEARTDYANWNEKLSTKFNDYFLVGIDYYSKTLTTDGFCGNVILGESQVVGAYSENPGDAGTLWGEMTFENSYWVGDLGPGTSTSGNQDWLSSYINFVFSPNGDYTELKFYYEIKYI